MKTEKAKPWRCGYCLRTAAHCRRRGASPVCDGCRAHLAAQGKKFCGQCGKAKPLARFSRIGQGDARRAVCQACRLPAVRAARSAYMRRWRTANPESRRAYARAYIAANPERIQRYRRTAYVSWKMRQSQKLRALAQKETL